MKRGALALAATLAASPAWAEPCPLFGLEPKPLREVVVAADGGGIVVGEQPTPANGGRAVDDRADWAVRVNGTRSGSRPDPIAPGLVVYRAPAGAAAWELVNGKNVRLAKSARGKGKEPALLEAPATTRVTSGTTQSRHPNSFVTVELSSAAPKDATALVLSKAKGPAYSWGVVSSGATTVSVFSTGGGCFATQSTGTVQAQPGETVTLFWVDQYGRRSRVTPPIVVEKP